MRNFFYKLFLGLFFVFLSSFFCLWEIDKRLGVILNQYINVEVERLTNNIVRTAIHEKMASKKVSSFLMEVENGSLQYDTVLMNQMLDEFTKYIEDVLMNLDNGKIEEKFLPERIKIGRFHKVKRGIICDVSLGSIRNSSLFANVGPSIPIKLLFTGQVQTDIDVEAKEYGINNVLVEVYMVFKIKEQVTMPISSMQHEIVVREPISIDIIKGEVPNYFGGLTK